jgi:hypothetical protein
MMAAFLQRYLKDLDLKASSTPSPTSIGKTLFEKILEFVATSRINEIGIVL